MPFVDAEELEDAVLMVSDAGTGDEAWVSLDTGAVHVRSDLVDPELAPLPDDIDTSDRYVPVPRVSTLELGLEVVFDFVGAAMPEDEARVRQMFKKAGGYRVFGELVDERGLSERWYDFREAQTRAALAAWCEENGLTLGV